MLRRTRTAIGALLTIAACSTSIAMAEPITNMPVTALDWETTAEGVAFAPLSGDRFKEAYMAMVRLPAGLVSPPHTKSANMFGVVISGTLIHVGVSEVQNDERLLPAGSFYKIPANLPHISKCVSQTDCVTFLYQDGSFDFLPVEK
ncbi:DUF4437 domain-containing protein [Hoeflea sp. TYP-13]|uniref:DUF4437 domain-containing protein n=1 Tax=Hoeflea sp. TYP-13 TaxID=3230023 RepID=UPI0034C5CF73